MLLYEVLQSLPKTKTVHIIRQKGCKSIYFGFAGGAIDKLTKRLLNQEVLATFNGFGGFCIQV